MAIGSVHKKGTSPTKPASNTSMKKKETQPDLKNNSGRKRSLPTSLAPITESKTNPENDFDHRTVNSAADVTETSVQVEVPKKKKRKRKLEPIDSEVEIFKAQEKHGSEHSQISLPPNVLQHLAVIRETMERNEVLQNDMSDTKKAKNKVKKKISDGNETSPSPSDPKHHPSPIQTGKQNLKNPLKEASQQNTENSSVKNKESSQSAEERYPVLKNQELVQKFLRVSMTNNQKGRIRQVIRDILKGTSSTLLPEVIHNRIQAILKSSENLTDTDLRKIRILYNMLKKATEEQKVAEEKSDEDKVEEAVEKTDKPVKKEKKEKKKKPKRYVVFVGNLPVNITKEQIMEHFCNLKECITDVRIPPREGKNSSIAYLELMNEPTYQLALSQHHSMLGSKRINVLYTTQKNSKMSKADVKAKGAKLQAMAKNGQLIGSMALNKKRSQRRLKQKKAIKAAEKEQNTNILLNKPRV